MEIGKFAVLISALRFARLRGQILLNGTFAQQELNKDFEETTVCDDARQILRSTPNGG